MSDAEDDGRLDDSGGKESGDDEDEGGTEMEVGDGKEEEDQGDAEEEAADDDEDDDEDDEDEDEDEEGSGGKGGKERDAAQLEESDADDDDEGVVVKKKKKKSREEGGKSRGEEGEGKKKKKKKKHKEEGGKKLKKKKRKRDVDAARKMFVSEEAEESGSEVGSDEEEEDERADEYDYDDEFLAKEGEEEEGEESGAEDKSKRKKRRLKRAEDAVVEEVREELRELVDERLVDDEDREEQVVSRGDKKKEKKKKDRPSALDEGYDSLDDFIEHDEDEGYEDEERRRQGRIRRIKLNVDQDQLEDLLAVFPEYDEEEEGEEGDEDEEYQGEEEEGGRARRKRREPGAAATPAAGGKRQVEPEVLRMHYLRPGDEVIRNADMPERMAERSFRTREIDEIERYNEASWIHDQLHLHYPEPRREDPYAENQQEPERRVTQAEVVDSIVNVLRFLQEDKYEVPFIWLYRRDELQVRVLHRYHLWRIASLDEQWERLQKRRTYAAARVDRMLALQGGEEADEGTVQRAEQDLSEAGRGVELWRKKVKQLQDKADRLARKKRRQEQDMDVSDEEEEVDDDEDMDDDGDLDDGDTLPEAKKGLAEAQRRHEAAQVEVQRLEQLAALKAKRAATGADMEEDLVASLVPESYRDLSDTGDEHAVKDLQQYLAIVGHEVAHRAHRQALDFYRQCRREKSLRRLADMFVLPAPEVGNTVHSKIVQRGVPTPAVMPAELIEAEFTSDKFSRVEDVLRAVRHMLALEVAYEPHIRGELRKAYLSGAQLSTRPTLKGRAEIKDPMHPVYGIHYISRKSVADLLRPDSHGSDGLFLRILKAEKEGLLTYTISPPMRQKIEVINPHEGWGGLARAQHGQQESWEPDLPTLLAAITERYQPLSKAADVPQEVYSAWCEERQRILEDAVRLFALPALEMETRRALMAQAEAEVVRASEMAFYDLIHYGPYLPSFVNVNSTYLPPAEEFGIRVKMRHREGLMDLHKGMRVLGICLGTGGRSGSRSYAVAVTEEGAIKDHMILPPTYGPDDSLQRQKLEELIKRTKPLVVAINVKDVGMDARYMKNRVELVIQAVSGKFETNGYENEENEEGWSKCDVVLVDETLARLYASTQKRLPEFSATDDNLLTAIALARQMQEPLLLATTVFAYQGSRGQFSGGGHLLRALPLHPLQKMANGYELVRRFEEMLVDAVNDVGVDPNQATSVMHYFPMLPFVCGLGFRKARALRDALRASGSLISRKDLIDRELLPAKVYENAAGFLRIRPGRAEDGEVDLSLDGLNILDNTRIHPECYVTYDMALKICRDSIGDMAAPTLNNELVSAVMQNSLDKLVGRLVVPGSNQVTQDLVDMESQGRELDDDLAAMDLHTYAEYLEKTGLRKMYEELLLIKFELRFPFRDRRAPFRGYDEARLFDLLTGETDETLRPGMVVQGVVALVKDSFAKVNMDGLRIQGFLHRSKYPGLEMDVPMSEQVARGTAIKAVVIEVDKPKLTVRVSCLEDEIKQADMLGRQGSRVDPCFDSTQAKNDLEAELQRQAAEKRKALEEKLKKARAARTVDHVAFKTMTFREAEDHLKKEGQVGDYIFRPSTSGVVKKDSPTLSLAWLFADKVVVHYPIFEDFSEGRKKFKLQGKLYQELDQVVSQFIEPMNDHVEAMMTHRKFNKQAVDEVLKALTKDKQTMPRAVVYTFYLDPRRAGYFMMGHIAHKHLIKEPIEVTPKGFKYRSVLFRTVDELAEHYKRHYKDLASAPHAGGSSSGATPTNGSSSADARAAPRRSRWGEEGGSSAPAATRQPPPPPPPPAQSRSSRWGPSGGR